MRPFFWNAFCRWRADFSFLALRLAAISGAVVRVEAALVLPSPSARITSQTARAALDLDEEEAHWREHQ